MITNIIKWASLPALLMVSLFCYLPGSYELVLSVSICSGAIVFVQRAVRMKEYIWAAVFVTIAVGFSPLPLVARVFFLMGFSCMATFAALIAAWKMPPAAEIA